jgi:hypothetical protein
VRSRTQLSLEPGQYTHQLGDQPEELARDWFSDANVKKQIADLLQEFDLDESAIEAGVTKKRQTTSSASTD